MSGQLSPLGAADLANHAGGAAPTLVQSGTPTQWIPGQNWYNTGSAALQSYLCSSGTYNSANWVASSSVGHYIALLTATPFAVATQSGNPAIYPSDITPIELTTTGYTRQPVTFGPDGTVTGATPSNYNPGYPAAVSNTGALTFGPMTANMALPVQWAALIVSNVASGTAGFLKYYWTLSAAQQVLISQSIVIPATDLVLDQS